ncbi:hypothetical protein, partial [Akkermansia sp.]|uniref:hypothetical protein n=1 Tax=Akkermansia sp. TaxID=1872421 RepID=UPI003AB6A890
INVHGEGFPPSGSQIRYSSLSCANDRINRGGSHPLSRLPSFCTFPADPYNASAWRGGACGRAVRRTMPPEIRLETLLFSLLILFFRRNMRHMAADSALDVITPAIR